MEINDAQKVVLVLYAITMLPIGLAAVYLYKKEKEDNAKFRADMELLNQLYQDTISHEDDN